MSSPTRHRVTQGDCHLVPQYSGISKSEEGYNNRWGFPALLEPADGLFALLTEASSIKSVKETRECQNRHQDSLITYQNTQRIVLASKPLLYSFFPLSLIVFWNSFNTASTSSISSVSVSSRFWYFPFSSRCFISE